MSKHTYKISVSNYGTTHTATYTSKAAALKATKALAKDWSSYADTGYSVYMDDNEQPIHEGGYKDGKAMLGY